MELEVLKIIGKPQDILVCRYLLSRVNYRDVSEAVDFMFDRDYETK